MRHRVKLRILSICILIFTILHFLIHRPKNVIPSIYKTNISVQQQNTILFKQNSYFIQNNLTMEKLKTKHFGKINIDYTANWDSLDSRPIPQWYDEAKVGIFVHWGVYSVIGAGEWIWHAWENDDANVTKYMAKKFPEMTSYQEFASNFTAKSWDPDQWVKLFKNSGAKYVVLTSKHHDGYTLWPSKYSFSWNSEDIGPQLDLVGELASAVRRDNTMHFGLYYSLYEWYNRLWISDKHVNNLTTDEFVRLKSLPALYELVNKYQPEIIWSDGEWGASDSYWKSKEFLVWLYNKSPVRDTVVVNDRWGGDTLCKHGGFLTCKDRFNPGQIQPRKFENAFSLDKTSWGISFYSRRSDYLTPKELIHTIVQTVACGGNALVNVGPNKKGFIPRIQKRLLRAMGEWLNINGEAIYKSTPWMVQQDLYQTVWYTSSQNKKNVFAILLSSPASGTISLQNIKSDSPIKSMKLLGSQQEVKYSQSPLNQTSIKLPQLSSTKSKWAWVIKISYE